MRLEDLAGESVLILGLGVEGLSTFRFLRELFPDKTFDIADEHPLTALNPESQTVIRSDNRVRLHLGEDYLSNLSAYDVIIKTPGMSLVKHRELQRAVDAGTLITSHTALFFDNCPNMIIGVTGTKGKGTTSKLIYGILKASGRDAFLVGNIGNPPLPLLKQAKPSTIFVFELSAQQLEVLGRSPHIAVLLNIVPDHLDHFVDFERYVDAKCNIARYQSAQDYLVYNAMFDIPRQVASESEARLIPYNVEEPVDRGCFIEGEYICCSFENGTSEPVVSTADLSQTLPEPFNLHNVLPAVAVARLLGISGEDITRAIRTFEPLEHRFELVGTYRGITFYNASIATVPEVTIEHINALGDKVQTLLLGGHDRGMDFSNLAEYILEIGIRNLILFPETGARIWEAVCNRAGASTAARLPKSFFIDKSKSAENGMKEAVELAYLHTEPGKICLHSPASSSFGMFKNYKHRGSLFKQFVIQLGKETNL